jgi:hypothetical protein
MNHEGASGGMEGASVLSIFNFSLHSQGVCYTKCLCDGDSKSYQRVVAGRPYDPNIAVTKLECAGHVQKTIGARLRRARQGQNCTPAKLLEAKVASLSLK